MQASPQRIWPLLCDSHMELPAGWPFCLGMPRPIECRLPDGSGAVGGARECVSNQGRVAQRILQWDEPKRLRFEMVKTDLCFRDSISRLVDTFDLTPLESNQTRVTRTTEVTLAGALKPLKAIAVWFGLKSVHRYVFRNWAVMAKAAEAGCS